MEPARVRLAPGSRDAERLDGVWWPRSRDLAWELPALIAAADLRFGRIDRATVHTTRWPPDPPRQLAVAGRTIDVGHFSAGEAAVEVCVLSNHAGRWDLLVVPPECEFADAEMALAHVSALRGFNRPAVGAWLARVAADRTTATDERARQPVR